MCEKRFVVCNGDLPVQGSTKFGYHFIPTFIVACGAESIINVNKMIQPFLGNIVLFNFQRQRVLQIGSVHPSWQLFFAPQLAFTVAVG